MGKTSTECDLYLCYVEHPNTSQQSIDIYTADKFIVVAKKVSLKKLSCVLDSLSFHFSLT